MRPADEDGEKKKIRNGLCYVPPVLTPALPRRGHIVRIRRNVRWGRVEARVSDCRARERPIGHVTTEGRMVPEPVLIEQLKARHVEQGVEGCPEIAVVARVLLQRRVEHVMRHSPAHPVIVRIAQVFRGLIRVHEDVVRMVETGVFSASGANEYHLQWTTGRVSMLKFEAPGNAIVKERAYVRKEI